MALDFKRVQKPTRKLRKLLKKMPQTPTPKQVHDFRTSSRQLEAIIESFGLHQAALGRRVLKPLSRLRKRAGKVRDMDVLTGYTTGIHPRNGEQDCAVQLLEHLGAQRRKHAKKLYSAVQRDGSRLRRKLKKAEQEFARLQMRAERNRRPVSEPSAAAIDMGAELASPPRLNRSNLHPFRLKVKELRNVLKLAETPDWDLINALGDVKDAIGEWHDSLELVAIAEKALDHGTQCKLIQQLKTIASDKYEMALSQAEKLRKRYVGSPGKKKPSRSGIGTPSEPVLRAAMKLVA